jgi:hypothetical protein
MVLPGIVAIIFGAAFALGSSRLAAEHAAYFRRTYSREVPLGAFATPFFRAIGMLFVVFGVLWVIRH